MTVKNLHTPLGTLALHEQANLLTGVCWAAPTGAASASSELLDLCSTQLDEYFTQHRRTFDAFPRLPQGTPFQQKVWQAIAEIPYGETITYAELAKSVGSAPRAVGGACGANPWPVLIPCHRVVGSGGQLTGYSGGQGVLTKRLMLDFEKRQSAYPAEAAIDNLWAALRTEIPRQPFYVMRHGETPYNAQRIMQGSFLDAPLNETGIEQAKAAGQVLAKTYNPSQIWVSPLKRTHETAQWCLAELPQRERQTRVHPGLVERAYGIYDGQPTAMLPSDRNGWTCFPEGESWPTLMVRLGLALAEILNEAQESDPPLIICHGGVMRALGELLGVWDKDKRTANCELWLMQPTAHPTREASWQGNQITG